MFEFLKYFFEKKVYDSKMCQYPADIMLHNALYFLRNGDYDKAYIEIGCIVSKSGGELSSDELDHFRKLWEKHYK